MQSFYKSWLAAAIVAAVVVLNAGPASAQSAGSSGAINGTILDPSGAVVENASVEIHNPVSGYDRTTTTDSKGNFGFPNVPFNPYHMTVTAAGFAQTAQDVQVRSAVPTIVQINLQVSASSTTVTVEDKGDLVENDPTSHTDIDRELFDKVPLGSASSQMSSLVGAETPGIASDSNGQLHGLGDHAENSFNIDDQPDTDQHSKVFSNQISVDSIQSMEVISGAPPAEYGGKTSVVIVATTRSGQGMTTPHGSVNTSYGSFGSSTVAADIGYGGKNWGNFISVGGLNSGRFLDGPEFAVIHDKGNAENVFDRVDFQLSPADTIHLNFSYSRSWFQTPNSLDAENATAWSGLNGVLPGAENYGGVVPGTAITVGAADQRSKIGTFNVAPSWTRLISTHSVFTLGAFVRRDDYNYYPSSDPFADLGPPSLQRQSVGQNRTLTNTGIRSDISYVRGVNNIKAGVTYEQTFLNENDKIGIVDPAYNSPFICASQVTPLNPNPYVPFAGVTAPLQCTGPALPNTLATYKSLGYVDPQGQPYNPNPVFYPVYNATLAPYDLTRGGSPYAFNGHTDVKELALYIQDAITVGHWSMNLGVRGDIYNGLTAASQAEPRVGISYNVKKTSTILRVSYARTLESPFNENLILSSIGCSNPVLNPLLACSAPVANPLSPGFRNEIHAGIEQAFGRYLVFSGEWITKYTHNGYDFSVLGNTPITFPIEWHNAKIPGYAGRLSVPNLHGFSAQMVFSSVAARFFQPQIGGAGATVSTSAGLPFRIDHDEKFNQTTHLQYQPWKRGPWVGFNWRYDSGLVAGNAPCYGVDAGNDCPQSTTTPGAQPAVFLRDSFGNPLSADQEFQAGFTCDGAHATPTSPLPSATCQASQFGSSLIKVPAINAQNDDRNPARIASRNLFDASVGDDNLFKGDHYKWSLTLTAINLTNKLALYNFLSTFSGTHYVTPRALTAEIGFHF
ncbi:MAG TPA: carboxypeptidase regulatory-like domain-containing protein [Terriglobales bacterium]|nr:carboxypeptidase regulatory-like domain-containing protein [Terriglobales bacterium]